MVFFHALCFETDKLIFLVLAGKSKTSDFVNITFTTQQQNITSTLPGEKY